jgi:hypothetical protein
MDRDPSLVPPSQLPTFKIPLVTSVVSLAHNPSLRLAIKLQIMLLPIIERQLHRLAASNHLR